MTETVLDGSPRLVASGGYCAPRVPCYDMFTLAGIPDDPVKLLDYWMSDLDGLLMVRPLPPKHKPFKRYKAKLQDQLRSERAVALTKAIEDLEICLSGGQRLFRMLDNFPVITAPRGGIRYTTPPRKDANHDA